MTPDTVNSHISTISYFMNFAYNRALTSKQNWANTKRLIKIQDTILMILIIFCSLNLFVFLVELCTLLITNKFSI